MCMRMCVCVSVCMQHAYVHEVGAGSGVGCWDSRRALWGTSRAQVARVALSWRVARHVRAATYATRPGMHMHGVCGEG